MRSLFRIAATLTLTPAWFVMGCGDATGPDAVYMRGTVCSAQFAATHPDTRAEKNGSTLFLMGTYGDQTLGISDVPAAVGTYRIGSAVLDEKPSAMVVGSRGTLEDLSVWVYWSDSGSVSINTLETEWVSGTFLIHFGTATGEAPHDRACSAANGEFRLRIEP